MSYNAKVYKVFIATPSDVTKEREIVRSVLARWNAVNGEKERTILLPIGWDTNAAPETGKSAQEYINEELLDNCDILIGIFWSRIGSPTKHFESGTIEEITRHLNERKLAMLYFSTKEIPSDADLDQVKKVRSLKKKYEKSSLYAEFSNEYQLESNLYNHIQINIAHGKFRSTYDSDNLAKIVDDNKLINEIKEHYPLVSRNLLSNIVDETRSDDVWIAIINKLKKSPADLRESLLFLSKRQAFKHKAFILGYRALAECSQPDFGNFMSDLYAINRYEFYDIFAQGLLKDSPFTRKLLQLIKKNEEEKK